MNKNISHKRTQITNNLLHYIYYHIDSSINLDIISRDMQISKFHLHRIFKEEFGTNIYATIKSIRLQKAANLLITNHNSTVSNISTECGYSTLTSFTRAFKKRFAMTPSEWKKGGYITYSNALLNKIVTSAEDTLREPKPTPVIKKIPSFKMYYIRHKGYDTGIKECWQKLQTFVLSNNIENFQQIAIYHDNPIIVPLQECHYIACVATDDASIAQKSTLPSFEVDTGIYAKFYAEGYHDDILRLIQWVYHEWLPQSGYETTTAPSFIIYKENNFLNNNGFFALHYYIPIILA